MIILIKNHIRSFKVTLDYLEITSSSLWHLYASIVTCNAFMSYIVYFKNPTPYQFNFICLIVLVFSIKFWFYDIYLFDNKAKDSEICNKISDIKKPSVSDNTIVLNGSIFTFFINIEADNHSNIKITNNNHNIPEGHSAITVFKNIKAKDHTTVNLTSNNTNTTIFKDDTANIVVNDSTNVMDHTIMFRDIIPYDGICTMFNNIKAKNHSTIEIINDRGDNPSYKDLVADHFGSVFIKNINSSLDQNSVYHINDAICNNHSIMITLNSMF
jgi:hypothetical protein